MAAVNDAEIIIDVLPNVRLLERTEETDGPASSRKEARCALGVGPQCVLHAADERADQGRLHSGLSQHTEASAFVRNSACPSMNL
jgi:hypothetical protein